MTVSERDMMAHDDEAFRLGAEHERICREWLASHEGDWAWVREYLDDRDFPIMLEEIWAADSTYDAKRKWSRRAAEKFADSELEINDARERLAKCEREET